MPKTSEIAFNVELSNVLRSKRASSARLPYSRTSSFALRVVSRSSSKPNLNLAILLKRRHGGGDAGEIYSAWALGHTIFGAGQRAGFVDVLAEVPTEVGGDWP